MSTKRNAPACNTHTHIYINTQIHMSISTEHKQTVHNNNIQHVARSKKLTMRALTVRDRRVVRGVFCLSIADRVGNVCAYTGVM